MHKEVLNIISNQEKYIISQSPERLKLKRLITNVGEAEEQNQNCERCKSTIIKQLKKKQLKLCQWVGKQ